MTKTQAKVIRSLETKINAALAAMPADKRPELSARSKVQSVAYSAREYFEATDRNGNTEMVSIEAANKWIA